MSSWVFFLGISWFDDWELTIGGSDMGGKVCKTVEGKVGVTKRCIGRGRGRWKGGSGRMV